VLARQRKMNIPQLISSIGAAKKTKQHDVMDPLQPTPNCAEPIYQ